MTTSPLPTERLRGQVIRVLHHGAPRFVFVEHSTPQSLASLRAVCEVEKRGDDDYVPIGQRHAYDGEETEAIQIAEAFACQCF